MALTFSDIAIRTNDLARKRRALRAARKAYDTILRLKTGVSLTVMEEQDLAQNLSRLKRELENVGEHF